MTVHITSLGHSTFRFTTPEARTVLIDPWTFNNPLCPAEERDVRGVDLILITHGHHDHVGDVFAVAQANPAQVVTIVELGKWLGSRGLKRVRTMNVGGIVELEGVKVTMTPAAHSSSVDEDPFAYVGLATGFVLEFSDGSRIYHAGDTAAFPGMQLIHEVYRPDVAMLPMGDHHTMGPDEAAVAARLLAAGTVIPMHYGITPESLAAPDAFRAALEARAVGDVEVLELRPGETLAWDGGRAAR